MPRVLLVEDDPRFARLTAEFLEKNGFLVVTATTGPAALAEVGHGGFDLVLLDLSLPGMDGLDVARHLRERHSVPLIMVTARGDDEDKIRGLELGADDYLAKPFNPMELLARIRSVLRRMSGSGPQPQQGRFQSGGLVIDFGAREVTVDGERKTLTSLEFDLLSVLARRAGQVLTRDQLLELVKGSAADESFDRSIDIHVSRLRKKIEPDSRHPRYLKTVRGSGYTLAAEGRE